MADIENVAKVRKQTRLALPEDDSYLYRLGVALYGFNSISSFMTEIICHIDTSQDRTVLLDKQSGAVLDKFRQTLKKIKSENEYSTIHGLMKQTADLFEKLNTERSDFVHTYPITNGEQQQILHRRKDSRGKYFEVDNDFLDSFIDQLHEVSDGLYKIRAVVRPTL